MTAIDQPDAAAERSPAAGFTDIDPAAFRAAAHRIADLMADYLEGVERFAVFPNVEPGEIGPLFATSAPDDAHPIEEILADYRRLVEPNATH